MSDWLQYTVPKEYGKLYLSHIGKNIFILIFIMMFVFGTFPSVLGLWSIILLSDAAFYHAVKKS